MRPRVAALVLGSQAVGCNRSHCERPLRAFCDPCSPLAEATVEAVDEVERLDALDVYVRECGADLVVIQYLLPYGIYGRFEYYREDSGALVGVTEWHDTSQSCGITSSFSFSYGDVPNCVAGCLSSAICGTESCLASLETETLCD